MPALTNAFVTDLLHLYFKNAPDANGLAASGSAGSLYAALHSQDPGVGSLQNQQELSYGTYTRIQVQRGSGFSVNTAQRTVSPAAAISFPKRADAGAAQTAHFWSLGTGASGATYMLLRGGIGGQPMPFTYPTGGGSLTCPGLQPAVSDPVAFWQYGSVSLPGGITEGTVYWVISVSGDTFAVSATLGGGAVVLTGPGLGTCQKLTPLTVTNNVTPKLETGTVIKF
jgi:hypothetical protein